MDKIANTFLFRGDIAGTFPLAWSAVPLGTLLVQSQYRGSAIRTGGFARRDDADALLRYEMPLDSQFSALVASTTSFSADSRSIGLSRLAQLGLSAGLQWKSPKSTWQPFENFTMRIMGGGEYNESAISPLHDEQGRITQYLAVQEASGAKMVDRGTLADFIKSQEIRVEAMVLGDVEALPPEPYDDVPEWEDATEDDAADLVLAGNIFVREYLYNSIQLLRFHNIDLPDLSMRNRRVEYFHIEQSFHNRNIIHIDRAACNMIGRVDITPFCSQRGYR